MIPVGPNEDDTLPPEAVSTVPPSNGPPTIPSPSPEFDELDLHDEALDDTDG